MQVAAARFVLAVGFSGMLAAPAFAQAIAHVTHIEGGVIGGVTIVHKFVPAGVTISAPVTDGDQVHASTNRTEITFGDSTIVLLDQQSKATFYGDHRLQLLEGRMYVRTGAQAYIVETTAGKTRVLPRGVFGISSNPKTREMVVQVMIGGARLESPSGTTEAVPALQLAVVSGPAARPVLTAWVPQADPFEQWASSRELYSTIVDEDRRADHIVGVYPTYRYSGRRTYFVEKHITSYSSSSYYYPYPAYYYYAPVYRSSTYYAAPAYYSYPSYSYYSYPSSYSSYPSSYSSPYYASPYYSPSFPSYGVTYPNRGYRSYEGGDGRHGGAQHGTGSGRGVPAPSAAPPRGGMGAGAAVRPPR